MTDLVIRPYAVADLEAVRAIFNRVVADGGAFVYDAPLSPGEMAAYVTAFAAAFVADYVVLGGGNAKKLNGLIPNVRLGHNLTAFRGGLRLWNVEYATTLAAEGEQPAVQRPPSEWRVV